MPPDFGPEQLKLERGDIRVRTRGSLTTLFWKDRQEVYMLTNMDHPPAEGNFCDNSYHLMKPYIMEQYKRHMGYVDNSDRMANSYSMSQHTFKWTTKLFFHLLGLTLLNSWILLFSCGTKYTHQDRFTPRLVGRPSAAATNVVRLESHYNQHRPAKSTTQLHCHLCSSHGQRKGTVYKCTRCDVGLCVVPCFVEYRTRVNL